VSDKPKDRESVDLATRVLESFLGLKGISITKGGPSPSDPEGNIQWYVGFRDGRNGFHFGIGEDGQIMKAGATINGKSCVFPVVEMFQ